MFICSGNPFASNHTVITREYLTEYYKSNYLGQSEQFQKLFVDIVNLCNQFSYYIDSFLDIDLQIHYAKGQYFIFLDLESFLYNS